MRRAVGVLGSTCLSRAAAHSLDDLADWREHARRAPPSSSAMPSAKPARARKLASGHGQPQVVPGARYGAHIYRKLGVRSRTEMARHTARPEKTQEKYVLTRWRRGHGDVLARKTFRFPLFPGYETF